MVLRSTASPRSPPVSCTEAVTASSAHPCPIAAATGARSADPAPDVYMASSSFSASASAARAAAMYSAAL